MKNVILVAAIALLTSACGGEDDSAALPVNDGADSTIDAACLIEEPECDDTPGDLQPQDLPSGTDDKPIVAISVPEARGASGPVAVAGFLVTNGSDIRLCEALAESFPPQCGGVSIAVSSHDQVDPDDLVSEGDVTWTDYAVTIAGEMVDGTLVATPIE